MKCHESKDIFFKMESKDTFFKMESKDIFSEKFFTSRRFCKLAHLDLIVSNVFSMN